MTIRIEEARTIALLVELQLPRSSQNQWEKESRRLDRLELVQTTALELNEVERNHRKRQLRLHVEAKPAIH